MYPKKQCGCGVHCSGPPAEKRSTQSSKRRCSATKFLSPCMIRLFSVGIFRRIGSFPKTDFFAIFPKIRPTKLLGGVFSPAAISIHAEQCASICATFIAPQSRSLSGLNTSIRFLISEADEGSNKLFTDDFSFSSSNRLLITIRFPSVSRRLCKTRLSSTVCQWQSLRR